MVNKRNVNKTNMLATLTYIKKSAEIELRIGASKMNKHRIRC